MSMRLDAISTPADVKALPSNELSALAAALREEMLTTVSKTGGHLASSLGAVELAIGLLRVFDPPRDSVVWDVGHQAYAWKMLTGRRATFNTLRSLGGLSGFCNPEESPCDAFVSGHAGNALAAAVGLAAARDLDAADSHIVAVVGDASLSNGESLEALNACASLKGKIILVVNDNAMSISKNVGSFARLLGRLLTGVRYNRMKAAAERAGHRMHLTFLRGLYHKLEQAVKSIWLGNTFFESFGLRYIGPVDGHDMRAVENALRVARDDKRSVVVHMVTVKGKGFPPAESNPTAWHGVGPFDRTKVAAGETAEKVSASAPSWSEAFGTALCELTRKDPRVCALTAAMREGTGLAAFAQEFPERFFDVGICESLLVTFAAGLAKAGRRPVVAVYSAFLQRAIDQVMHDVCLLKLPVVFAIDHVGCVGADGRTHHGMFDIPMLRCLPNLVILQPKNADELKAMLEMALAQDGPVAIRYPKGPVSGFNDLNGLKGVNGLNGVKGTNGLNGLKGEQLVGPEAPLQLWALGDQVPKALEVAGILGEQGITAGVVNACLVKPVDVELLRRQVAAGAQIVTLENGALAGGFGSAVQEALPEASVIRFGWPDAFVAQGTIGELEAAHGLTAQQIATRLCDMLQPTAGRHETFDDLQSDYNRHSTADSRTTTDIRQPTAGRHSTTDNFLTF